MSRGEAPEGTREHVCNVGGVLCTASTDMCPPLHDVECEQPLADGTILACTPQKLCIGDDCVLCPTSRCVSTVEAETAETCRCRCIPRKIRGASSSEDDPASALQTSSEAERFMPVDAGPAAEDNTSVSMLAIFAAGGGIAGAAAYLWLQRRGRK